jgi:glycosyltransferase involved in cell wall biosynthesis
VTPPRPRDNRTICLFIPHLAIGGSELQLSLLARELLRAGQRPIVASFETRHEVAEAMRAAGIEVVVLPRRGKSGADAILGLARLVRRENVALVHAWLWVSNWRAALARVLNPRVPVLLSIRSMEDDIGRSHERVYRLLSPLVDAIVVNGRAVMESSASRTGIARSKYRIVPNAVEADRLEAESRAPIGGLPDWDGAPVAGYVGGLQARKRVRTLARIAPRILARVPETRFLIVGDGAERAAFEADCARLGVSDKFHFAGYRTEVAAYVRRLRVLVHPSMNEGCCNAILEAEALGVPPVAYAVGGNPEIVREGETGLLVPDGDEDALADAAVRLLAAPSVAREMGVRGTELIRREYSVEQMTRRTLEVYDQVLGPREG